MQIKQYLIFIGLIISHNLFSQEIIRIEPPNWWVGMKDPSLQIMLYGSDIGDLEAKVESGSIQLIKTSRVENPNYLFVDLIVKPNCRVGSVPIKLMKGTKEVLAFNYPLHERAKGSAERLGFNSSD